MNNSDVSIDLLLESSAKTLESLELTRLNHAANLRKQLVVLLDQLVREATSAEVARWFIENRDELRRTASTFHQVEIVFPSEIGAAVGDVFGTATQPLKALNNLRDGPVLQERNSR